MTHSVEEEFQHRADWMDASGLGDRDAVRAPVRLNYLGSDHAPEAPGWRRTQHDTSSVTFRHEPTGLQLELELRVFDDFAAVEWVPRLRNTGAADSPPITDWQSLDTVLALAGTANSSSTILDYVAGSFGTIDDFAPRQHKVDAHTSRRLTPGGGRSSSEVLPFFNVHKDNGYGVAVAVGWTGDWALEITETDRGPRVCAGLDRTDFVLHPGETVRGPRILLIFWSGMDEHRAGNLMRRFLVTHRVPRRNGSVTAPPVSCAAWGATPAEVHGQVIAQLAEQRLPFETYWIDAGWFGDGQKEWLSNVGSWDPAPETWPEGLRPAADAAHQIGMDVLLWFEPERVCRGSSWYREHPEWILRVPESDRIERVRSRADPRWVWHESRRTEIDGGEGLFNLADDHARAFLIDEISDRIHKWGIDVYRNDFNFSPSLFWRNNDQAHRIGITEMKYIAGLYEFFDELLARHPGLQLDNCAGGGRRIDLEMLARATVRSRSDYVDDPVGHQCHTYGLSTWVPTHAALPHTGFSRYSIRSGMTHGLSLSWATSFNLPEHGPMDLDFEALRVDLAELLSVRHYFLSDFYPLTPYSTSEKNWLGYQFDEPETSSGIALLFRRADCEQEQFPLQLHALHSDHKYLVEVDDKGVGSHSGGDLMSGMPIVIPSTPGSALIRYRLATPDEQEQSG